jgi:hypothetical protein
MLYEHYLVTANIPQLWSDHGKSDTPVHNNSLIKYKDT